MSDGQMSNGLARADDRDDGFFPFFIFVLVRFRIHDGQSTHSSSRIACNAM